MAKKPTLEHVDASIARWKARLKRAMTALGKLEKQRKRLVKAAASPPRKPPEPAVPASTLVAAVKGHISRMTATPVVAKTADNSAQVAPVPEQPDLGIPAFLQRPKLDPVAAEIKAEQDETKLRKSRGRIAKMKAKKSGETRKMPLSGRAALAAIRNG